jgi:hypothetical protein
MRTARAAVPGFDPGTWERDWGWRTEKRRPNVVLLFFPDEVSMPSALQRALRPLLPAPSVPPLQSLSCLPSHPVTVDALQAEVAEQLGGGRLAAE